MRKREQGILTVESSIVLTLLLLAMLFLFSFARMYRAQNLMGHATLQTADAVALESFLRETALSSDVNDVVHLSNLLTESTAISAESLESLRSANLPKIAKQKFVAAIAATEQEADRKLRNMGVRNGLDGVDLSQSYVDLGRDDVIIIATYTLDMQFPAFGADGLTVTKTAKAKTFGDILFEVSTSVNQPTWGSTKGDDKVVHGSTVILTATPNYGYKFVSWNDGVTDNPRTVTVTNASHYQAIFERDSFGVNLNTKVEYDASIAGMSHNAYGTVEGAGNYLFEETATIKAVPAVNYMFVKWSDGVTDNPRTLIVNETKHFTAVFKPVQKTVTVKSSNASYGWAKVRQGGTESTSLSVEYGSNVQLIASTYDSVRYSFVKWSNDDTGNTTVVTVKEDITYEAIFKANTYTVRFYADNHEVHTAEVLQGSSIEGSFATTRASMPANPTSYRKYFKNWTYNGGQTFTKTTSVNGSIRVDAQFGIPSIKISGGRTGENTTRFSVDTVPSGMSVSWTSSNNNVATVDSWGNIACQVPGEVTITAYFELDGQRYDDTVKVRVNETTYTMGYCMNMLNRVRHYTKDHNPTRSTNHHCYTLSNTQYALKRNVTAGELRELENSGMTCEGYQYKSKITYSGWNDSGETGYIMWNGSGYALYFKRGQFGPGGFYVGSIEHVN